MANNTTSTTTKTIVTEVKKRAEFGQKVVTVSWAVTIIWISLSFILAFLDKDTNSTVTVTLITETFGVTLAYFVYQATLKTSRNKYCVDSDGVPYKVKQKLKDIYATDEDSQSVG